MYVLAMSPNLSIYTFFDIEDVYLLNLFFKVLTNFSATLYLLLLYVEYISILLFCSHLL